MRKVIILLGILWICSIGLWAKSAASARYEQATWSDEKPVPIGTGFLLRPILEGKTIVVSLWIENEQEKDRPQFSSLIKEGYNAWFEYATQQIKAQGREAEFADVLRYINRPISIQVVPDGKADLAVRVWKNFNSLNSHCQHHGSVACYHDLQMEFMKTLKMADQRPTFIHEIGHSLGLADQYHLEIQGASTLYASYQVHDEIMKDSDHLGCGDVDGLINLIDITLKLQRPNGARWKSFCPGSKETFKNGISSHANRYIFANRGSEWMLREYENSEKISEKIFPMTDEIVDPFYVPQKTVVLQWDGAGRPAHLRGELGEDIYNVYGKEEYTGQLVVLNNKVLSVHKTFSAHTPDKDEHIFLIKSFGLADREGVLTCEYGESLRAIIYEEFRAGEKKPYFRVTAQFTRYDKNKVKNMKSIGERDDSVLFTQFKTAAARKGTFDFDEFAKQQMVWQARFIDWAEHWPEYLGFLPEK